MQDIPLRILIKIVLIAQFYFIIYQIIGNILRIKLCPNIICKFGIIYLETVYPFAHGVNG